MDLRLKGLTVVIGGATMGIGVAIAERFAQEGCDIAFFARDVKRVHDISIRLRRYNVTVYSGAFHISPSNIESWINEIPKVDILIPNISAMSSDWRKTIDVDLLGTLSLIKSAKKKLIESEYGAITLIGSKEAGYGTPGFESYGAIKAAMIHYMKSISLQYAVKDHPKLPPVSL